MRTAILLALLVAGAALAFVPEAAAVQCEPYHEDRHAPLVLGRFTGSGEGYVEVADRGVECTA